jgi:hypothetical protein
MFQLPTVGIRYIIYNVKANQYQYIPLYTTTYHNIQLCTTIYQYIQLSSILNCSMLFLYIQFIFRVGIKTNSYFSLRYQGVPVRNGNLIS